MAIVQLIPTTMWANPININLLGGALIGTTKKLAITSSDSYAIPTTASQYAVRIPKEGKVGVVISMLPASSLNCLGIKALVGQSTDGAWRSAGKSTAYIHLGFTATGQSTAVNSLTFIPLADSAQFAQQSTVNTAYNIVTLQLEGSTAPGTTGSTTLATVATTIAIYAYQMP